MADEALRTLEQLRERDVDAARAELVRVQRELARADERVRDAAERLAQTSRRAAQLRSEAVQLTRAADFSWAERSRRSVELSAQECERRLTVAQNVQAGARVQVHEAERRVLDAEVARRAASQVLSRRDAAHAHKLALRAEEEAEDQHRARRRRV